MTTIAAHIHTVVITTCSESAELAADALFSLGAAAVEERPAVDPTAIDPAAVEVIAVLGEPGAGLEAALETLSAAWQVRVEIVASTPAETWKEHARPIEIGDWLVLRPAWWPARDGGEQERIEVVVDPGASFGLGDHPTTRLCAAALGRLVRPGEQVLDMGCGSGVLSIVACRLGARGAIAVDIAPDAVLAAERNAAINGVSDQVDVRLGAVVPSVTADVVVANILAPVLVELCRDLVDAVAPGGRLVLSGLLADRHAHVLEAYRSAGLTFEELSESDGWCALVFSRDASPRS